MVKIQILEGDITKVSADALVNAANNHLRMGAGVAGAIRKAGGKEIEEEAIRKGPISVGEVVDTGAGKLPVKYIIHAAVMGQDLRTDAEKIRHALSLWKEFLKVGDPDLTYENMQKGLTGKMFRIAPKRIKLFDQELFKDVDDGEEPVLEL